MKREIDLSEIVYEFLSIHNNIKIYHWQTRSYSRHKASDKLFENLLDLIDKFVETCMGKLDHHLSFSSKKYSIELKNISDKKIVILIKKFSKYLQSFDKNHLSTDLLNIRDEILGVIHQTLYLFTLK